MKTSIRWHYFPILAQFLKPKVATTPKNALWQQLTQATGAVREELLDQLFALSFLGKGSVGEDNS